jgi:hypothetical protein
VVHLDRYAFYSTVDVSKKKTTVLQSMMLYYYYYFDDDDRYLLISKKNRRCHIFDKSIIGTINMSVSNVKGHSCPYKFSLLSHAFLFLFSLSVFFVIVFFFFFLFNIASSSSSTFRCNNRIYIYKE